MKLPFLTLLLIFSLRCAAQEIFSTLEKNIGQYYHQGDTGYGSLDMAIKNLQQDAAAVDMVTIEVYQKKEPSETEVQRLMAGFDSITGKWGDLNYGDKRESAWDPKVHTERILLLASLYTNPRSVFYKRPELKSVMLKGIRFWFDAGLTCKNWWYNEIGVPKTLGPVFILLRDELSPDDIKKAVIVLNRSTIKMTGQNKVWLAGNVLFKAILLHDEKLARLARDTIFSELKISASEGIQKDYSFHQHGPQQQFGNYGLSFVNTMSFWLRTFAATPLQTDREHLAILRDLMLNGYNWITWKGYLDINSFGRHIFKGVDKSKALAIACSMLDMTFIDPVNAVQYLNFISRNFSPQFSPQLAGTKHFWRSDMTVHRSANWFATIKMSSDRVQATETLNRENLKGYYLGDGNYFVNVRGDEYEEIFPYWNWKKLPGVTNYQPSAPLKVLGNSGYRNKGDFTGGVVSEKNGITAFRLDRDSLKGNKAYFWYNDKMVCLGNSITTESKVPVSTTVNQVNLKGTVYFDDGRVRTLNDTVLKSKTISWVYHDNIGYYNLRPSDMTISSKDQTGSWGDIAFIYDKEKPVTKPVFTLEISHDVAVKAGNYAYEIVPDISLSKFKTFKPDFVIVQNDQKAQAIVSHNGDLLMVVVYQAVTMQVGSFPKLNFISPGLYVFHKKTDHMLVSIADPTQKLSSAEWVIGGKNQATALPVGLNKGETIDVQLPLTDRKIHR